MNALKKKCCQQRGRIPLGMHRSVENTINRISIRIPLGMHPKYLQTNK